MRKLKIDKKTALFIAISAIALIELLLILPLEVMRIVANHKILAGIKQNLVSIEEEWPKKGIYVKNQEVIKKEIENTHGKFVNSEEASNLYSFISSGSKNFSIEIKVLNPAESQDYVTIKQGKIKYLPITIIAHGSFHNLARFFEYLQNSRYFFETMELKIISGVPINSIEMVLCGLIKVKE